MVTAAAATEHVGFSMLPNSGSLFSPHDQNTLHTLLSATMKTCYVFIHSYHFLHGAIRLLTSGTVTLCSSHMPALNFIIMATKNVELSLIDIVRKLWQSVCLHLQDECQWRLFPFERVSCTLCNVSASLGSVQYKFMTRDLPGWCHLLSARLLKMSTNVWHRPLRNWRTTS